MGTTRFSTSSQIDLPLMVRLAAGSEYTLEHVEAAFGRIIQMAAQHIGINIDPSQVQTLEQMQNIIQQYGIGFSVAGKEITVMAQNARGLSVTLSETLGKVQQLRQPAGAVNAEGVGIGGQYAGAGIELTNENITLSQNQLSIVQSLITAERELMAVRQQRYAAERQGWDVAAEGSAQRTAYEQILQLEDQRLGRLNEIRTSQEALTATEDSELGHTLTRVEAELQLAEARQQATLAAQGENALIQVSNRYLQITRQLYSAEEQLARARQSGTSEAYITQQQQVIAGLRQQQQGIYQLLEGTEQYEALLPQLNTMEQQHQANLLRLGGAARTATAGMMGFKAIIQNIIVYGIGYRALYSLINAFRQTIDISKELNASMTDLRIATGKSREEAEAMIDTYNELAQSIGATTKEVADSATKWLRQGYSEADTNKLIYDSMVLSKVGMIESSEATEYLTSAMKGYKVEVDDAMGIIDKLTKIDLNAAVSSGELAEAMSKTANSARLAGVSMDELLGYIATVAEVTQQSASTVGTSFKSIFSRFSKISAGSFVDEETGEDLNEISRVLGKLNIELYRTDGSMRSVSDVLKDVSAGWANYTDVEKNAIATSVAGTRQKEAFLTLMENFPDALNYAALAMDSTGTAEQKFGAYLDSVEAATNNLKAAWESFAKDFAKSDVLKGAINALTGLIKVLDSGFGKFILTAAATMAILKLLTAGFIKLAAVNIGSWISKLGDGFLALRIAGVRATSQNYLVAQSLVVEAEAAETAAAATAALNVILTAAAILVAAVVTAVQHANKAKEDLLQKSSEIANTINRERESLAELREEYVKLASSENRDESTRENIKNVQERLVELIGEEAKGLDLVNGKLDDQLKSWDTIVAERLAKQLPQLLRDVELQAEKALKGFFEIWTTSGVSTNVDFDFALDIIDQINYILDYTKYLDKSTKKALGSTLKTAEKMRNILNDLWANQADIFTSGESFENALKMIEFYHKLIEIQNEFIKQRDRLIKKEKEAETKGENKKAKDLKVQISTLEELIDTTDKYRAALSEVTTLETKVGEYGLTQATKMVYKELAKGLPETQKEYEDLVEKLTKGKSDFVKNNILKVLADALPQFQDSATQAKKTIELLNQSIESLQNVYKTLTTAISEYNSTGALNLDTMQQLVALDAKYLGYMFDASGRVRDRTEAIKDLMQAEVQQQALASVLAYIDTFKTKTSAEVIAALQNQQIAVSNLANAYTGLIEAEVLALGLDKEATTMLTKQAIGMFNTISRVRYPSSASTTKTATAADKKYEKTISYVTATIEKRIKALEKEKEAIEEVKKAEEEELAQYDKALSYINKYVSARIKELEDERDALKEKNDEANREIELEELRNNLQKARQRTMRVYYEGQGWVYEQDPEALRDAQKAIDDFNVENLTKAIEDLIEQWQEYLDLWEKIPDTYDEYAEELAFKQDQSFVTEEDLRNQNLSGLEKFRQAYFKKEKKITETTTNQIDKQIAKLNDLKSEWSDLKNKIEYQQNAIYAKQTLGTANENKILGLRLSNMQNFVKKYADELNKTTGAASKAAGAISGAYSSIKTPDLDFSYDKKNAFYAAYKATFKDGKLNTNKFITRLAKPGLFSQKELSQLLNHLFYNISPKTSFPDLFANAGVRKILGFASGTKASPSGLAVTDEEGYELKIPPKGQYSLLQKGTGILPNNLTERVFELASNPALFMAKAMGTLNPYALKENTVGSTNTTHIHIASLALPNVNNVDQFVKELQLVSANR